MSGEIQVLNFVSTTLRAPVSPTDTQLQLATGSGSQFNAIDAGNFVFLTVNDATTVEVMKYTSSGMVFNDVLTVTRAQDGTTAKSFPTGSCVAIGWNVEQVTDLIDQEVLNLLTTTPLPADTIITSGPPVGTPPVNVIYAVDPTTGQLWFYNSGTSTWIYINSNSTMLVTAAPTAMPPANIRWAINTITSSLYYWTGLTWILVAGGAGGGPNFLQVLGRRYLAPGGVGGGGGIPLIKGNDVAIGGAGGLVAIGMPFPAQCQYKSNLAISDAVIVDTVPPFANTLKFTVNCVAQLTASIGGILLDVSHDFRGIITIHHATDGFEWQTYLTYAANSGGNVELAAIVTTDPIQITAGDHWDVLLTVIDGGASYTDMTMQALSFSAQIIALL